MTSSIVAIRSVQRRNEKENEKNNRFGSEVAATFSKEWDDSYNLDERRMIVKQNRGLPLVEGTLTKFFWSGPLGIFGEAFHDRWFQLDPAQGSFMYWDPVKRDGPPKQKWSLVKLVDIDWTENDTFLFLTFAGQDKKKIKLKAVDMEEFQRWRDVLRQYNVDRRVA